MDKVIMVGAGGHSKSVADSLDKNKYEINNFLTSYYERYTGLYLKSKNFIKALKNL